jgi:hypothetical protein
MRWLLGTFDRLIGTVMGAVAGLSASQTQAFILAYLQRLGGHLDEARVTYQKLQAGQFLPGADPVSQERMATAFGRRVEDLSQAYSAIADADAFVRPFQFAAHMDRTIAEATLANFTPALPLDTARLVYALIGIIIGLLLYELVKLPLRLLAGRRRFA